MDVPCCGVCSSRRSALIRKGVRYLPEGEVRRCADCDLVYLWPRPTDAELAVYYTGPYRAEDGVPTREDSHRDASARLARLEPLFAGRPRLLEVGAGDGAFIALAGAHTCEAVGIDPENGTTVDDAGVGYDLVVLFHVLHHVRDPVAFLRDVATHLGSAGRLVVEVPSIDDALLSRYHVEAFAEAYFKRPHLYYFSRSTLATVLETAGFDGEISGVQRYGLGNHLYWLSVGEPAGHHRFPFVASADAAYARALIAEGVADTLWSVAGKR